VLRVSVSPWAEVSIAGRREVQTTPAKIELPAGTYRVTLRNEDLGRHEVVVVEVEPGGRPAVIVRHW
jgi:hypothetical protein